MRGISGSLEELRRLINAEILSSDVQDKLGDKLERLKGRYAALTDAMPANDAWAVLPRDKKAVYEEFVSLVYECSPNKSVAKALVDRMIARIRARESVASGG